MLGDETNDRRAIVESMRMMADAGLSGYERIYPGQTSSGVKRRIEIVRALYAVEKQAA